MLFFLCGWCKCWLIIPAPSNPLVQGRWASCGSLMEEVPLPSGNALGTSCSSCRWHFSTISFLVTWIGSPLQGLLGIQFFRGLLCVVKEQRKKISTLNVTLSLSVSLSISFGMELCWGLADNCLHCWAMWSISLRWWSNLDWFTTGGEFNSLAFPLLRWPFLAENWYQRWARAILCPLSKPKQSDDAYCPPPKYLWWCHYMGSPDDGCLWALQQKKAPVLFTFITMNILGIVCNLHMKWQISVKSHFIIKRLVSLAFLWK
jgi:hypothetical protein